MADFRKWFLVVAVVLLAAATANAANWTLPCTALSSTPTIIRDVGITEYVGEIDATGCDSTSLTPLGSSVSINFTLTFNATVTNAISGVNSMSGVIVQRTNQPHLIYSTTQGQPTANTLYYPNVIIPTGTTFGLRFVNIRVNGIPSEQLFPTSVMGVPVVTVLAAGQSSQNGGINVALGTQNTTPIVVGTVYSTLTSAVTSCTGATGPTSIPLQQCVDYTINNSGAFFPGQLGQEPAPVFGLTYTESTLNRWAFKNVADEDGATIPDLLPGGTAFAPGGPGGQQICDTDHNGTGDESVEGDPPPPAGPTPACDTGAFVSNGTRLVAIFNITDSRLVGKVHIWVSRYNTNSSTGAVAELVTIASPSATGKGNPFTLGPSVICTGGNGPGDNNWVQLPDSAVETGAWELEVEHGATVDDLTFGVAITYAEMGLPSLPEGSAYSPISIIQTIGPIDGTIVPVSQNTVAAETIEAAPVPRFFDPAPPSPVAIQIDHCVTNLLFPYVTDVAGYQTGIAISNTSLDTAWNLNPSGSWGAIWGTSTAPLPYNTTPQAGTCNLYLFGSEGAVNCQNGGTCATTPKTPAAEFAGSVWAAATANVSAGTTFADTIDDIFGVVSDSTTASVTGYVLARCEFQFAHGLAFIVAPTTFSTQDYLALVIPDRNIYNSNTASPTTGYTATPIRIAQPFSNAIFDEQGEILSQ